MIRSLPIVKKLIADDQFETAAKVELADWSRLDEASSYASGPEIRKKQRRRVKADDARAWWDFECRMDATKFRLKFG